MSDPRQAAQRDDRNFPAQVGEEMSRSSGDGRARAANGQQTSENGLLNHAELDREKPENAHEDSDCAYIVVNRRDP
jgi:hypothetical protein